MTENHGECETTNRSLACLFPLVDFHPYRSYFPGGISGASALIDLLVGCNISHSNVAGLIIHLYVCNANTNASTHLNTVVIETALVLI
jgi:hypothetical protein